MILYELLAGGRPRGARDGGLSDLIARIESGPPPLAAVISDIPADLQGIVTRCLEKDPNARYQSAGELLVDLERLGDDGRFPPSVRRARRAWRSSLPRCWQSSRSSGRRGGWRAAARHRWPILRESRCPC